MRTTDKDKHENINNHPDKSMPKKRKKRNKKRILLTILMVFVAIILIGCLAVGGYVLSLASELPDITAEDLIQAQTSFVYDQMGTEIAALHGAENRTTVDLDEMPDYLLEMVIASEDERFYEHNGVDIRGIIRALMVDLIDTFRSGEISSAQGASTITMQLVRNVIDERETTLERKIKEALLAVQFEKSYDKDDILYYYVNEIYIGPEIYGMQAGAEYYFNKDVGDITMSEAALLVAMIRNPGYYSPYNYPERALNIRNTVLNLLAEYDPDQYGESAITAKADELVVYEGAGDSADYQYPWYVDYVISEASDILAAENIDSSYIYTGGFHIYTTMDVNVQNAMETAYTDDSNFPTSSTGDIVESGMIIIEPTTGQIKGLVGGRVYETRRGFNRATDLVRSPGSTIKPIVSYGPAVALGYGSGTVIDDAPVTYGSWSPKDDDWQYEGRITMRQAIVESRNICAVKMLQTIGETVGWEYGVKMGLPLVASDANLALTLGGLTYGVSPLDMAGAFSTFANYGVYIEPYAISKITDAQGNVIYTAEPEMSEVMSEAAAYIVTDMLTSAVSYGTGTRAKVSGWQTAGKTGTNGLPPASEDPDYAGKSGTKDAWFVGYTTALTGAVWMGYDDKKDENGNLQYLSNVYGGTYPAALFNTVMTQALENYENESFSRPDGVISASVDTKVGGSPTSLTPSAYISSELFLEGYGPSSDGTVEWVTAEICVDSGAVATAYCPNTTTGVYLQRTDGSTVSEKVDDYALYLPSTTCTLHTSWYGVDDDDYPGNGNWDDDEDSNNSSSTLETPYDLAATVGSNGITLTWQDNNNSNTTSYVVERVRDGSIKTKQWIYGKYYVDTDVYNGHTYSYRVYAYNEKNEKISGWSDSVSVDY
jgi:penicillin-binding protein 1A